jgi:hypothetical protein
MSRYVAIKPIQSPLTPRREVDCYERALSINPHMCQIREAIRELKNRIGADV